ncbi:MAG: hypothetical protein J5570_03730 [Lachnospiraceae bacterium]|nr:hypothetical protein [Lachnospiraceae bacterium]
MKIKYDPKKIILILLTLAAGVKLAAWGWTIDEGYAFAMGNRLVQGDRLFIDMWELHQTSAYAVFFFLKIFRALTSSCEGEVLFVRAAGAAIQFIVSFILYLDLKKHMPSDKAFLLAIVYANLSPKQMSTPEHSNILNWTSTLVLICIDSLWSLKKEDGRLRAYGLPILTGALLSLCVLSYPQAIIFAVFVFVLILVKGEGRIKNFVTVLCTCAVFALVFILYILRGLPLPALFDTVKNMIAVDSTHVGGLAKFIGYMKDCGILILFASGFGLLSYLTSGIFKNEKLLVPLTVLYVFTWKFLHIMLRFDHYSVEFTFGGVLIVIIIALIYAFRAKQISGENARLFLLFGGGGAAVFLTVLVACNQSVFSSAKYLSCAVVAALAVGIDLTGKKEKIITFIAVIMIVLVNIVQLGNHSNKLLNIIDADARVPIGPQKGIIMERLYANKARIDFEELPSILDNVDFVMITGDAVTYLYTDARIGNGSTIMTEDYGERFGTYWEVYPEKKPDIIAIECYEGLVDYRVVRSWLYEYATGEFGADEVIDTTYYRLYIRHD